jgi:lipopolysaccharide transport system permease protein
MTPRTEIVPEIVIRPSHGWADLRLGELWDFRELIWIFGWRDVAVRYTQSMLGILWAIIQPLTLMIVFSVVFGRFAKMPSDGLPYPIFSYAGVLPWTLFSSAIVAVGSSIVNASQLIQKTYIPRLVFPLAACVPPIIDFAFAFLVLAGLMAWYGVLPSIDILLLPVFILFGLLTALAFGLWIAVLNVYYRDFRYLLPFTVQILMFLSPVIYPLSVVDGPLRKIISLNPMVSVITGIRWCVLGSAAPDWPELAISVLIVVIALIGGLKFFRRFERRFADVI